MFFVENFIYFFFRASKSDTAIRMHCGYSSPRIEKCRGGSGPAVMPEDLPTPTTELEV